MICHETIEQLAADLDGQSIDILINNAGILPFEGQQLP